jgi:serine/threonine protein kinase
VDKEHDLVADLPTLTAMDARDALRVPGYVAEELVGFGTSGEVWRGRSLLTDTAVALKLLAVDDIGDGSRLRRQAARLSAVDHPHLLRIREVVVAARSSVLVLDYAAGGSLAVLLRRRGRLRPGEVVTVLAPVAAALAHVHGAGLSHGAVTPPNILFTVDGRPMLADLGIAELVGARPDPETAPGCLDPAVAAGAPPGPASDVFMLAAVAVHALTGTLARPGADPGRARGVDGDARLAGLDATMPAALVRVLRRALSPVLDERGTAAELALDLRHACQPEPVRLVGDTSTGHPARAAAGTTTA